MIENHDHITDTWVAHRGFYYSSILHRNCPTIFCTNTSAPSSETYNCNYSGTEALENWANSGKARVYCERESYDDTRRQWYDDHLAITEHNEWRLFLLLASFPTTDHGFMIITFPTTSREGFCWLRRDQCKSTTTTTNDWTDWLLID